MVHRNPRSPSSPHQHRCTSPRCDLPLRSTTFHCMGTMCHCMVLTAFGSTSQGSASVLDQCSPGGMHPLMACVWLSLWIYSHCSMHLVMQHMHLIVPLMMWHWPYTTRHLHVRRNLMVAWQVNTRSPSTFLHAEAPSTPHSPYALHSPCAPP